MKPIDKVREALEKLIQMWTTGGCGSVNAVELGNKALPLLDGKVLVEKPSPDFPKIVCLCGSTRFADQHAIKRWELERDGSHIVLMINYLPGWYADEQYGSGEKGDHIGEAAGCKEALDELHMRKIDMADEVFVINPGGYIGNSTRREIEYAKKIGKPVAYLTAAAEAEG